MSRPDIGSVDRFRLSQMVPHVTMWVGMTDEQIHIRVPREEIDEIGSLCLLLEAGGHLVGDAVRELFGDLVEREDDFARARDGRELRELRERRRET